MTQDLSQELICHEDDLVRYSPPGHIGTVNVRLADRSFCPNFEMVLGRIEPGGVAHKHFHETEHQAMYVMAGTAQVTLENEDPVTCGPGSMVKFPPKVAHHVLSMGPEVLELMIIYSPPLPKRDDTPLE